VDEVIIVPREVIFQREAEHRAAAKDNPK